MRLNSVVVCVGAVMVLSGCAMFLTPESMKTELASGDQQRRTAAERKIENISLRREYPMAQRVEFMSVLDNDEMRLRLLIKAAGYGQSDMLVQIFKKMELKDAGIRNAAISCLKKAPCLERSSTEDEAIGRAVKEKLNGIMPNKEMDLVRLLRENVEWRQDKAYWIGRYLYTAATKQLADSATNQNVLCMLYSGFRYNSNCCEQFDDEIVEKALSKISDKGLLWSSYTNGYNNIRDKFHNMTAEKFGEKFCVERLCEVTKEKDFNSHVYYPIFEGVKSQRGLADIVINGRNDSIIHWAADKIVDDKMFIEIFKAGKGNNTIACNVDRVKDKNTISQLIQLTQDTSIRDRIIERGLKAGWDPTEVVMQEKGYTKNLFDCLMSVRNELGLRTIADNHSLSLVRYYALSKFDAKRAEALAAEESERSLAKHARSQGVVVNHLGLDMDLSDAFFIAKKTFPEEKFTIDAASSHWSIEVVGRQIDFARAHYEDGKVYWMNFTPSMVQYWIGGVNKSVNELSEPVERKLGVKMGSKQIAAKMYFNHELLDALCDEKYPPARQIVRESIMTSGDVIRYFPSERSESLAIVPILVMNPTFYNWYKGIGSDPKSEATKAARRAANNLGWILAQPGTLRFAKPIKDNGF